MLKTGVSVGFSIILAAGWYYLSKWKNMKIVNRHKNQLIKPVIISLILSINCLAQSVDFFRENINIDICDTSCSLKGAYYFKNVDETPVSRTLYYPFVINHELPVPDSISVFDRTRSAEIKYVLSKSGILFPLEIPERSIVVIDIFYHQKTPASKFEYILLTTQEWHKPLDSAEFRCVIPQGLHISHMSYPFKKINSDAKGTVYSFRKRNFAPEKNLNIKWADKK